jgi:hypothetical protein
MDISPIGLARSIIPNVPHILTTAVQALFGISPNADNQDLLTELIVALGRPVFGTPASLLNSQHQLRRDFGVWGPIWVSKCKLSKPDDRATSGVKSAVPNVQEALLEAIRDLGDQDLRDSIPDIVDVEAEWTGHRSGALPFARRPNLPEEEQYKLMMREVKEDSPTMLYLHGGAFW